MEEEIKKRLNAAYAPHTLDVINESNLHAGHAGDNGTGESHFKLIIASKAFEGKSRVQSHKMIYNALNDLFDKSLHALSIEIKF